MRLILLSPTTHEAVPEIIQPLSRGREAWMRLILLSSTSHEAIHEVIQSLSRGTKRG